jgi:hypothetical protein
MSTEGEIKGQRVMLQWEIKKWSLFYTPLAISRVKRVEATIFTGFPLVF